MEHGALPVKEEPKPVAEAPQNDPRSIIPWLPAPKLKITYSIHKYTGGNQESLPSSDAEAGPLVPAQPSGDPNDDSFHGHTHGRARRSSRPNLWNSSIAAEAPLYTQWHFPGGVYKDLHHMESFWASPDGKVVEVTIPERFSSGTHYYDGSIHVVEHSLKEFDDKRLKGLDDKPPKTKNKVGAPLQEGRTMASPGADRTARWKAKKKAEAQGVLHVVEDQNRFVKCEQCRMYHRASFEPGRDVRFENGEWVEPDTQWVWGELPAGATLV
jgi:hypothetical protein